MSGWGANNSGWGGGDAAASAWSSNDTANGGGSGWNNDFAAANGTGDEWNTGSVATTNGDDNYGSENMHVGVSGSDGGDGNSGNDRAYFNCGEAGHNKAGCPNPRVLSGACRRCNKEGYWSKVCPNTPAMKCRECDSPGHVLKGCPERKCKNCGETGHTVTQYKAARNIDRSHLPNMSTEEAWALIMRVTKERDIDDVKQAIQIYVKPSPEATYPELEQAFRTQDVQLWLIAIEKPNLAATLTNMDLQGNLGEKYTITYRFQWNSPRPRDRELWPKDVDENIERLKDAGEVVDGGLPKCRNCDEVGHIAKSCPQEKIEKDTVCEIKCYNCEQVGHRIRDCPTTRVDKFACKNCGYAADCPEPRSAADVECRKCGKVGHVARECPQGGGSRGCGNGDQEGHMARDCTEPRYIANVQCRNCDEYGHVAKDCPKPRDVNRVKCSNCQQLGHFKPNCPNPLVAEDGDGGFGGGDVVNADFGNGGSGSAGFAGGDSNGSDACWTSAPVNDGDDDGGW
ncbi:Cellular nucleic acid-binding protein [Madurella mycetomatis]|uniref:Cellular nucleic acid-binding protein n=1 Tax=Madurella mycetomatis TaxID=100816 RepID=A0A175W0I2_9PEZI|nr:Cellular nucleic acid-binding protein [Madurella mycetomatis]